MLGRVVRVAERMSVSSTPDGSDRNLIDAHAHWYPSSAVEFLAERADGVRLVERDGGWWVITPAGGVALQIATSMQDEGQRLQALDEAGISVQVLSLGALDPAWGGSEAASLARVVNEDLAGFCRKYPERFRFLASLALKDAASGIRELDRALEDGAIGVSLTTTHGGSDLDAPEVTWFWREASSRALSVVIHPCVPMNRDIGSGNAFLLSGFPSETTIAATRLVLSGTLALNPGVRVMWSHLGGGLPMLVERLDAGARAVGAPASPSEQLSGCWFDAVSVHPPAIRCARESFGASRLVFGTDLPHTLETPGGIVSAIHDSCSPHQAESVLRENALDLFPMLGVRIQAESGSR